MSQQNKDLARRREELERKRRQLQDIQGRQAQELGQSLSQADHSGDHAHKALSSSSTTSIPPPSSSSSSSSSVDVDALLQSVLPSSSSSSASSTSTSAPLNATLAQSLPKANESLYEGTKLPVSARPSHPSPPSQRRDRSLRLTMQSAEESPSFDLDPEQVEMYSKSVQTSDEFVPALATLSGPIDTLALPRDNPSGLSSSSLLSLSASASASASASQMQPQTPKSRLTKDRSVSLLVEEQMGSEQVMQSALQQKTLSQQQIEDIVQSETFVRFVERSAKIVQRVLDQPEVDFTIDYARDEPIHDSVSAADSKFSVLRKNKVENLTTGHTVTSIEWSPKNPDLYLASYFNNNIDSIMFKYGGSVLVWSMILASAPEFTFRCNSPVTTASFSPFNPNLIIGGTQSGQIVLWDIRDKSLPVQKSKISSKSHNHPVRCLKVTGNQNAHQLTTISNDGRLCTWSLDRLSDPQDSSELPCSYVEQTKRIPIAATCFSYIHETSTPVIGTEEGSLYEVSRSASKWAAKECYTGHSTMITSVECNSYAVQHRNYTDLILTSSLDWSCKLWSRKTKSVISTFEVATDYVYDAKWCPSNPSLFATADGTGTVSLWDLATQPEGPSIQKNLGQSAVNCLSWSTDSKYLAAGDSNGDMTIFRVNQELTSFGKDTAQKFEGYLSKVQNPNATEDMFSR